MVIKFRLGRVTGLHKHGQQVKWKLIDRAMSHSVEDLLMLTAWLAGGTKRLLGDAHIELDFIAIEPSSSNCVCPLPFLVSSSRVSFQSSSSPGTCGAKFADTVQKFVLHPAALLNSTTAPEQ